MNENSSGNKIVKGVAVIGIAGIIVKVIGAFFRIPLTNWMGGLGMSYYGVAYTIYSALVVLSTAGFPVAVSRLVSENNVKNNYGNAHKVFKVSFEIMLTIGVILAGVCFFGAEKFAELIKNPDAALSVKSIAPALLFVPLLSAFRGFFQGRQNMNPTAISEIIEQIFRVAIGLFLAKILLSRGLVESAAGATFGASAGSFAGLMFMILVYFLHKKIIKKQIEDGTDYYESSATIAKKVLKVAIPIVIGAEIIPIMYTLDMSIIMRRLVATGWSEIEADRLYGLISGYCNSLINMPEFLIQAIAISLVPAIARANAIGDRTEVKNNVGIGYKLTTLIAFPSAVGMFALAKPILILLYPGQMDEAIEAAPTLMILTASMVFLAIYETSTGVLQAIGKQMIPVRNVAIGAVVRIITSFILVGIPSMNIKGAAVSASITYFIAFYLNEIYIKKYVGIKHDMVSVYGKPFAASAIMGICAFGAHKLLNGFLGNSMSTLIAVMVGVIVYAAMVIAIKVVTSEELEMMPKGNKLNSLIRKIKKDW